MSGITWAGGDSYYMVADNADNGYKGERPASGYRIYASPTPDFANREDVTTAGEFTSDPADWSTSWRGSPSADARFFSVVGER